MQVVSRFTPMSQPAKLPALAKPVAQHLRPPAQMPAATPKADHGGFEEIIDIINPLQHIPVISTLYRKLTGDEIGQVSRIAGDTLYGGVFGSFLSGLVSAVANVVVEAITGRDIGAHIMAAASPEPSPSPLAQQAVRDAEVVLENVRAEGEGAPARAADATTKPEADFSLMQTAVEQYQWHMLEDEEEERPGYWA